MELGSRRTKLTKQEKSILAPLAFFDIFQVPLRDDQFWESLFEFKITKSDFEKALANLLKKKIIEHKDGWYFLKGQEKIVSTHKGRRKISQKYLQKAERTANILKHIPFVRMVSAINNLSFNNCKKSSDIDLFIITASKRLWICRTLVVVVLWFLGLKKTRIKVAGQICCGFFITENHLNIKKITLEKMQDIYLLFWFLKMKPLSGFSLWQSFRRANLWAYHYFPNYPLGNYPREPRPWFQKTGEAVFGGWFGDWLNSKLGKYHKRHTWAQPENSWETSTTVADNNMLKLHAKDMREFYFKKFEKRMKKIT